MTKPPHSKNLREHRLMAGAGTFFVTKGLQPRKAVLIDTGIADTIVATLANMAERSRIWLASFVVMPDHWHALFAVPANCGLSATMKQLGSWIGRKSKTQLSEVGCRWQEGYYDTRIRSGKQFNYVIEYIEQNPVEKEFVATAAAWRWSSASALHETILTRPWPWQFEDDVR